MQFNLRSLASFNFVATTSFISNEMSFFYKKLPSPSYLWSSKNGQGSEAKLASDGKEESRSSETTDSAPSEGPAVKPALKPLEASMIARPNPNYVLPTFPVPPSIRQLLDAAVRSMAPSLSGTEDYCRDSNRMSSDSLLYQSKKLVKKFMSRLFPNTLLGSPRSTPISFVPKSFSFSDATLASLTARPPSIAVIGIHGWFPMRLLQRGK